MPVIENDDQGWWNAERKLEGICREIAAARGNGSTVLLLAHFEGTLANLEEALRVRRIDNKRLSEFDSALRSFDSGHVSPPGNRRSNRAVEPIDQYRDWPGPGKD